MISGRNKPAEYASRENLTPGKTSSVMHAPPTIGRRSRTRTFSPAFARYAAETRPLWPPPTMTASHAAATVHGARHTYVSLLAGGCTAPGSEAKKSFYCAPPPPHPPNIFTPPSGPSPPSNHKLRAFLP